MKTAIKVETSATVPVEQVADAWGVYCDMDEQAGFLDLMIESLLNSEDYDESDLGVIGHKLKEETAKALKHLLEGYNRKAVDKCHWETFTVTMEEE